MSEFNKQATMNQFITHLRFLGYEVKIDEEVIIANHPQKSDVLVFVYSDGTMLKSLMRGNNHPDRKGYLELINELNHKALITRYYADPDADLMYEAFFPGEYSQTVFARFLDLWDADFQNMLGAPNLERYLK